MKSKTRIKKAITTLTTRTEAEACMRSLAEITNARRIYTAERDAKVLAIDAQFAEHFAYCDDLIKMYSAQLSDWALAHPEEFPKDRKTLTFDYGTITQRTGTHALKLLRGWNWERALGAVMSRLPNFIRSKPEIDKEGIIATRDELEKLGVLPLCGLKIDQGEKLHIEPKLTELETRQTLAA
jgi:phage host-nuclease inhibitor protein Gam